MRVRTATFDGVLYDIDMYECKVDGLTDVTTQRPSISIMVPPGTRNELETIIHEGLEAEYCIRDHDDLERSAREISRLLWRLGYRRKP